MPRVFQLTKILFLKGKLWTQALRVMNENTAWIILCYFLKTKTKLLVNATTHTHKHNGPALHIWQRTNKWNEKLVEAGQKHMWPICKKDYLKIPV